VLGPFVVLTTLAVLGTGVALVLVGPGVGRSGPIPLLFLHKAAFVLWAGATGVHVLGRLIPAARLVQRGVARLPGRTLRAGTLALTLVVAVVSAVLALSLIGPWSAVEGARHSHVVKR
jgi:hypothetical protein